MEPEAPGGKKGQLLNQQLVDLGPVEDFPEGQFRLVRLGKREIGVLKLANGRIYAVANFCPHRGAPLCKGAVGGTLVPSEPGDLIFGLDDGVLRCPWHGYEFALETGECLFTGQRMRMRTYPVEVRDGRVHIDGTSSGRAGATPGDSP